MLHEFLVVFRDRCRFGTETVRGGLEVCRAGAGEKCQPVQDSSSVATSPVVLR